MRSLFPLARRTLSLNSRKSPLFEPENTCECQECSLSLTLGFKSLPLSLRLTRLRCFHAPHTACPPHRCSRITFQTNCLKNTCPASGNYLTRATYVRGDDLWSEIVDQPSSTCVLLQLQTCVGTLKGSSKTHGSLGFIDFQGERLVVLGWGGGYMGCYWQIKRVEIKERTHTS